MAIKNIERELPVKGEGSMFDIYRTPYKFDPKRDKSIKRLQKSERFIRGFVESKSIPDEGSIFKMTHHQLSGKLKFGALKLIGCHNVIEEDGVYYFEVEDARYILEPILTN